MKKLFILALVTISPITFANTLCTKWENNPDFVKAIEVVATEQKYTYQELCTKPNVLDIEAQPGRVILRDGTVIPHVTIQLHFSYHSCLFKVSKTTWDISESRCYSGF